MAYKTPVGLYYSKEHEWVKLEGNLAKVGITDFAQSKLGDVVYVELPEVGKAVLQATEQKSKEMEIGAAESIKAVSSIYSPISGTVKEVNEALKDQPELLNTKPYDEGWLCVIDAKDAAADLKNLIDSKSYEAHIATLE